MGRVYALAHWAWKSPPTCGPRARPVWLSTDAPGGLLRSRAARHPVPVHLFPALTLASALLAGTAPLSPSPAVPAAASVPAAESPWRGALEARGTATRWASPIDPPHVLRPYAPPERNWLPGHRGLDLATTAGHAVRAAGDGVITQAGSIAGRGVVVISHGALRTTYEPVTASVRRGQAVVVGQVIGVISTGTGHCGDGSCLHLGLRRGAQYLDPTLLLGRRRAILVPW